jgi:fatty acid synthase subunit alpha
MFFLPQSFHEQTSNIIQLHGDAKAAAVKAGVKAVQVSISHSDAQAIAIAVANF